MKRKIGYIIIAATLMGLPAGAQEPYGEETYEETTDYAAIAVEKANEAADAYRVLKKTQYDGVAESELFPMVLRVHQEVTDALADPSLTDSEQTRLRSILLDLDPLLIQGAIYYSTEDNREEMNRFARACVDTRMRSDMGAYPFSVSTAEVYPSIIYCAASDAYNTGDYDKAIDYFQEYLGTNDNAYREQIAQFLGQACVYNKTPQRGLDYLVAATAIYPANYNLLMITLQNCLDAGDFTRMKPLVEKALSGHPDDEQLLNLQASLYEDEGNYSAALDIYTRLYEMHPTSMSVNRHIALCYYNLGSEYYNKSVMETDEKIAKRLMRQSKAYFGSAVSKLGAVVDNDPSDAKYIKALAMAYACLGETEKLQDVNTRLSALGEKPVNVNGMPEAVAFSEQAKAKASPSQIPDYQEFARRYVESNLAEWSKRKEFEKMDDFQKRMTQANVEAEYERLCREAEQDYLKKYSGHIRVSDLTLEPYDIDNESYLINSDLGPIVVHVPLKGKEAETFKSGWSGIQLRNLRFYIKDNQPAIASVDLVTPGGKTYSYNAENATNYDFTEVKVDVASFLAQGRNTASAAQNRQQGKSGSEKVIRAKSDVDRDIPVTSRQNNNAIAVIWANENYSNVTGVPSALNDGEAFAEYCTKTLGIPASQVYLTTDATYAQMVNSISTLKKHIDALGDGVDLIFYYAGHGIPDEKTKDAFLIPTDGVGSNTETMYSLKRLYNGLAESGAGNVMVFLDACFSGATRGDGMVVEARGVALKPREAAPEGSMMILSAASGDETAMPYKEKNHGMFTYFLLKKLQDSKGNVTLKELSDYVVDQVKRNSISVNRKSQTPSVKVSGRLQQEWNSKKLRP
ncbi:MAG: caspase family protein [Muribaculaceae bacterium]|nr:caspase family protein [Muribaculaceae bacterium]